MSTTQALSPGAGRRGLFRIAACGCLAAAMPRKLLAADAPKASVTAQQALDMLRKGNQEFAEDRPHPVAINRERRQQIAGGQSPHAVVVACSDSRVAPELLFTSGLGELFVVRVAGNTVERRGLGSIEYGVVELGAPLVMVLGHERCGAVQAAVKAVTDNASYPDAIQEMVEPIIPAVVRAQKQGGGDLVLNAVKENVRLQVQRLKEGNELISPMIKNGKVQVVGGYYSLSNGQVEFL